MQQPNQQPNQHPRSFSGVGAGRKVGSPVGLRLRSAPEDSDECRQGDFGTEVEAGLFSDQLLDARASDAGNEKLSLSSTPLRQWSEV